MKIPYLSILIGGHALIAIWLSMAVFSSEMDDSGYAKLPETLVDNPEGTARELIGIQDITR